MTLNEGCRDTRVGGECGGRGGGWGIGGGMQKGYVAVPFFVFIMFLFDEWKVKCRCELCSSLLGGFKTSLQFL